MSRSQKDIRWRSRIRTCYQTTLRRCLSRIRYYSLLRIARWGETLAARHLERQGLLILQANWRQDEYELDLVALDGRTLVVIEVKCRRMQHRALYPGLAAVNERKKRALRLASRRYESSNARLLRRLAIRQTRLDVVEIYYRQAPFGQLSLTEVELRWHKGFIATPSWRS